MPLCEDKVNQHCYWATDVYLLIMLAGFPLFTGIHGYMYLHLKKFAFFVVATLLWLTCLCIEAVRRVMHGGQLSRPQLPELLVLAFMLFTTLSTICSPFAAFLSLGERYDGLLTHLLYGGVFIGIYRFGQARSRYLYAFAVSYTFCCVIALLQLFGWNALWLFPDKMNYYDPVVQETGRFLGTVGNIDVLSALHCLAIPLLGTAFIMSNHSKRFALIIPLCLGLTCQIWAGVFSGLLAMGVTAALLLPVVCVCTYQKRTGKAISNSLYYSGLLILLVALALLYFLPVGNESLYEIQRILHGELRDEYGSHRILIWRRVLEVVRQHPLLGVGSDSLWYYLDIQFERYSPLLGEVLYSAVDNAHNEYLQILASFGILGFLPVGILIVYTVIQLTHSDKNIAVKCLIPSLLCYMIQSFFNIGLCIVTPLACIAWGLELSAMRRKRQIFGRIAPPPRI